MHIGTVTTGSAGSSAAASIVDDGNNSFTLNMIIPRGDTGSRGSTGPQGPSAISNYSLTSAAGYIVLNNGFKIQWKNIDKTTGTTGAQVVTPPINFTTFSFALSEPIAGTKTMSNTDSISHLTTARMIGASVVPSNALNTFYIYHSTSTTRYVVMLGV